MRVYNNNFTCFQPEYSNCSLGQDTALHRPDLNTGQTDTCIFMVDLVGASSVK